ncbi:MAG: ribose-phosphate pyrophosphokinase, partial [Methanobacterium sp.]
VNASKILKEHCATKEIVSCVHPVRVEDSLLKIFAADVAGVISTDTLRSDVSLISVAQIVADAIK